MIDNLPTKTQECQSVTSIESQLLSDDVNINMKDVLISDYWTKSEQNQLSRRYLLFKRFQMLDVVDDKGNFL